MAWQGVPFSVEKIVDAVLSSPQLAHVVLDKIPTVAIESSFSWDTVIAASISGFIPGWIAYLAIRNSYKLADKQHKMQSKEKINQDIRVAAASYVTALNYFATDYNEWVKEVLDRRISLVTKESMPDHLRDNIYRAESSKNLLIILIFPDENGMKLLNSMGNAQKAITPLLDATATRSDVLKLRSAVDSFMFSCHEYFLRD
ncbi:hypothetical protein [Hafnia paralvei]|uniref:hypothetical protein n=1 Tax=Hafnia paralvei TaxID=546367 RepID=UPI0018F05FB5|nr:hypothetical protein [Hafnia paralvei]MBW2956615.1 hypothetical protein [Hafnia paralvei]